MKSLFKEIGGTYTLCEDGMYYPDLKLVEAEVHFGKYGRMRKQYLQEHRPVLYSTLLLGGKLAEHLNHVDDTANKRTGHLIQQMQRYQNIDEALKSVDQMAWVGAMNQIRHSAEEIVLKELIFC